MTSLSTALRFPIAPGYRLNVRSGPGTGYSVIRTLPEGSWVTINCQTTGTNVTGPYGTSRIWDCIGNGAYVSDAYVRTGSDGYVATRCS
ncbi:peptidase [Streptomyces sp. NPDC006879]|uniref:peptidase n=1 Tax=Streptomyces sp. NPDC006879 TaxID=3364767 RepID=UPI0036BD5A92